MHEQRKSFWHDFTVYNLCIVYCHIINYILFKNKWVHNEHMEVELYIIW